MVVPKVSVTKCSVQPSFKATPIGNGRNKGVAAKWAKPENDWLE